MVALSKAIPELELSRFCSTGDDWTDAGGSPVTVTLDRDRNVITANGVDYYAYREEPVVVDDGRGNTHIVWDYWGVRMVPGVRYATLTEVAIFCGPDYRDGDDEPADYDPLCGTATIKGESVELVGRYSRMGVTIVAYR